MELDIIKSQTTWNDAVGGINSNFAKIKAAFATVGTGGGGGLDEDELRLFLEQNGYTTENWVKLQKYLTAESADLFFARKEWVEQQIEGIDLSPYAKSTDVANTYATISALNTLEGKHDALRNEFDALSNLLSSDTTDYINTWNEVVAFLDGYKDESDLATILSGMNADISSRLLTSTFDSWKADTYTPLANLVANHTTKLNSIDTSITNINIRIDGVDKTIEDHIAEFIAFRANFEISDDLILVRKNFASTEEVSAKGINQGTGGGGGSSFSRLDTWEGYDNNKAGYVLSAGLGYGLKVAIDELNRYDLDNRVRSIENSYVSKDAGGVVNGGLVVSSLAVAGGSSSQFLKADGSLDGTSYLPTSGGTLSGAIQVHELYGDIWSIGGDVYHLTINRDGGWAEELAYISNIYGGSQSKAVIGALGGTGSIDYLYLGLSESYNGNNLRISADGVSFGSNTLLHSGNYSDIIGDYYLKTSGGTIKGSSIHPLTIDTYGEQIGIYFSVNGSIKTEVGWDGSNGAFLYNYVTGDQISLTPEGEAKVYINRKFENILHSGNIGSYALSTSGGTISNDIWAYQLNLNALNTDAGLRFSINGALKGLLRVDSNQDLWYQGASENLLLHSGNVGDYAFRVKTDNAGHVKLNDFNIAGYGTETEGFIDGPLIRFGVYNGYYHQDIIAIRAENVLKTRSVFNGTYSDWKTIAFTDSDITGNAGSATKLATARSIWGHSFDGTGDISGRISNVTYLTFDGSDYGLYKGNMFGSLNASDIVYYATNHYFYAGSAYRMLINSYGNVTIGDRDKAITSAKLYVDGTIIGGSVGTSTLGWDASTNTGLCVTSNGIAGWVSEFGNGTQGVLLGCRGASQNVASIGSVGGTTLALNPDSGNVGIGTTDPQAKLHVNGVTRIQRDYDPRSYLDIAVDDISVNYNGYDTDGWCSHYFNSNGITRMAIIGLNGYVGIGTADPAYKLDVIGDIRATESITIGGATLSWENGTLKVNTSFYSEKEISAKGLSTGGGSGASYNRLDAWGDYDSSKAGYVLSAYLGDDLNTRLSSLSGVVDTHTSRLSSLENAGYITSSALSGYLPTSGGTLSRSGRDVLTIDTSDSYGPMYQISVKGKITGSIGHIPSESIGDYGLFISNADANTALLLASDRELYFSLDAVRLTKDYTLLHSGNIGDYAPAITANQWATSAAFIGEVGTAYVTYRGGSDWSVTDNGWSNEYSILHRGNFHSYAPTLTGTGASGTWGIDITGSSVSTNRFRLLSANENINLNTALVNGGMASQYASPIMYMWNNAPDASYGSVIQFSNNNTQELSGQLLWDVNHGSTTDTTRSLWWRAADTNGFTNSKWHQIAFTDSNVASATKLATAINIWGQSFDGTGNVDGNIVSSREDFRLYNNTNRLFLQSTTGVLILGEGTAADASTYILGKGINFGQTTYSKSMLINSSGNVTIGGSDLVDSGEKLHVDGRVRSKGIGINRESDNAEAFFLMPKSTSELQFQATGGGGFFSFHTAYNGMGERMRIANNGNVGIGTANPQYKLDVDGTGYFSDAVTLGSTLTVSGLSTLTGGLATNDIHGNGQSLYLGNASNNAFIKVRENMVGSSSMWSIPRDGKATFTSLTTPTLSVTGSATIASVTIEAGNATLSNLTVNTVATLKQLVVGIDGMSCNAPATFNDFIYGSSITPRTDNYYVLGNNNYKWYAVTAYNVNVHDAITIEAGKELRFKDDNGVVHTLKYDSAKQAFVFDGNVNATGEMSAKKLNA